MAEPFIRELFEALEGSVDPAALEARVRKICSPATVDGDERRTASAILARLSMGDLLDDSILGAKPDEKSFPLRVLLGEVSARIEGDDDALALAAGLNFYFRARIDEDARVAVGLELSRAYYTFTAKHRLDRDLVARASPLLAALLSTEVSRVRFEAVDHAQTFDSASHERAREASTSQSRIARPVTFLCRVAGNNMVRTKAIILT